MPNDVAWFFKKPLFTPFAIKILKIIWIMVIYAIVLFSNKYYHGNKYERDTTGA